MIIISNYRRRENGNWLITIEKGKDPMTGERKRRFETVSGDKNSSEVEEIMAELILEEKYGVHIDPDNSTVGDILLTWLEDEAKPNLNSKRSFQTYERVVKKHLIPSLGHIPLKKFSKIHVKKYQSLKLKDGGRLDNKKGGLSNNTVIEHMNILHQGINYAVEMDLIKNNPVKLVKKPKYQKPKINHWNKSELNKVLKAAKSKWIYDYIYLSVSTGMRQGEVLGLKWKNVNLKKEKLKVVEALKVIRGEGLQFGPPKTESSYRTIPLSKNVVKFLSNLKDKYEKQKNNEDYKDNNLVICEDDGRPSHPNTVREGRYKKLLKEVDVKYIRPHDLRHTFASLLFQTDPPTHPKVVQEILGHKSIRETLDTYTHMIPLLDEEAIQKLDNHIDFDI